MEKKVLVPVSQGIEPVEAITIIAVLRRAGANVIVASVDELEIMSSAGIRFFADQKITDCMDETYDLIALPGGIPGAQNLCDSGELISLLKKQAGDEKYYAAICASPALVLHHHGLVRPGCVTCHPAFVDQIDNGNIVEEKVVVDGNCVTSRGAGTAVHFALKLVELMYSKETAAEVAGSLAISLDDVL
ncbi:MAG: DJ-1 family protein [Desulfobacteraceae bacterium]|nr:DJ-1 family protein [Desulfobacteraceae bacterium]